MALGSPSFMLNLGNDNFVFSKLEDLRSSVSNINKPRHNARVRTFRPGHARSWVVPQTRLIRSDMTRLHRQRIKWIPGLGWNPLGPRSAEQVTRGHRERVPSPFRQRPDQTSRRERKSVRIRAAKIRIAYPNSTSLPPHRDVIWRKVSEGLSPTDHSFQRQRFRVGALDYEGGPVATASCLITMRDATADTRQVGNTCIGG